MPRKIKEKIAAIISLDNYDVGKYYLLTFPSLVTNAKLVNKDKEYMYFIDKANIRKKNLSADYLISIEDLSYDIDIIKNIQKQKKSTNKKTSKTKSTKKTSTKKKSSKKRSTKEKSTKKKSTKKKSSKKKSTKKKSTKKKSTKKTLKMQSGGFDKTNTKFPRKMSKQYCEMTPCSKMGFSQKASCRYYKNCYA
uniref:Uncharacterized protein n=1 Tax=viral metagenome TaxID=1070528 RepID=A0A6C0DZI5_9ZZZZ